MCGGDVMSRPKATYEIIDTRTNVVIGEHRTRQAAIDNWRTAHTGIPVKIIRRRHRSGMTDTLIVEGTWHEAIRLDGA